MATETKTNVQELEAQHVLQTYKRQPVVFERGEGMRLFDDRGRAYLDFLSGIGVAALGHGNAGLAKVLGEQAKTLIQISNLYFHPLQGALAARLSALTGLERAFFCNSGSEANEACLKFARRYWHTQGANRAKFVAFTRSFHGRTMGSLSVTSDEHYRAPFQPLIHEVVFVDTADSAALARVVDDKTAAIIVEPIQGEGGVRPIAPELAAAISSAATRTGALVIADEVQSGSGRTGTFLASGTFGLTPDLVSLGKALGAGMPIGAAMVSGRIAKAISAGDHGTTYGGNLLACRAALYFLDALESGGVLSRIPHLSAYLFDGVRKLQARHPGLVTDVRGAGLFAGIDLRVDALPVITGALDRGLIVNRTSTTVVRLLPAYIVSERDIDEALAILDEVFGTVKA